MSDRERYILGTDDHELARLKLQQEVWSEETDGWIDLLGLRPGERVLDAGCGPGLATERLRRVTGPDGHVLAVDGSQRWIDHVDARVADEGWSDVETRCVELEQLDIEGSYDAVFMRWVLSFPRDPAVVLGRLAGCLVPGGRLLAIDYNHEGVSLYPRSAGFDAVIRATRALYVTKGGSAFIAGRFPELFEGAGLQLEKLRPTVIAGRPGSPAFDWADAFFPHHVDFMVQAGVLSPAERELFLAEWAERRQDPEATFYSPIVVAALGTRP
ncbi:class I SAM-dependent methyltransferase [Engelhardtia mirabilis]|uniref:Methyltransferase domain-containing protein n=1 Tax=Engelhardtia mirabilis TaxID=2528011 RepID=A0A518BFG4_9BACT|nr:hypothetical protein Pla133_07810 [Planctomycetes bacterium Pla133]QDV00041.1 hypothetical protein Pla86_07800 [Planctomycetes bacterium Pla86]